MNFSCYRGARNQVNKITANRLLRFQISRTSRLSHGLTSVSVNSDGVCWTNELLPGWTRLDLDVVFHVGSTRGISRFPCSGSLAMPLMQCNLASPASCPVRRYQSCGLTCRTFITKNPITPPKNIESTKVIQNMNWLDSNPLGKFIPKTLEMVATGRKIAARTLSR